MSIEPQPVVQSPGVRTCLIGIFLILLIGAVYFAKAILLPIALAFMLTLTLSPVVRFLARRGIPEFLSALAIVLTVIGVSAAGIYYLSGPISGWIEGAPRTGLKIQQKIRDLRAPVDAAVNASKEVEKITKNADPTVQKVEIQREGLLSQAAGGAMEVLVTTGTTMVLMFFMLASGRMFYEKLARTLPTLTEKKRAIRMVHAVEDEVSSYLLTISVINLALGVVIALAMWLIGMPNPVLWGVMAAALNFVPYVGALVGAAIVTIVAFVSFEEPVMSLAATGLYLACTIVEGQFVTPTIVGKRLEMNTVAVFLAVAIWGWIWGVPGALMAVPFLVSLRVLCEHFDELQVLGEFLGGPEPDRDEEEEPARAG